MHRYHSLGKIPRKRHTVMRDESGNIYHEELKGNKGFSGPSSLLYHIHPPTEVLETHLHSTIQLEADPDPRLRMRHVFGAKAPKGGSPVLGRTPMLFNDDVTLYMAFPDKEDDFYYRNGQGDEIVFVHHGKGVLESAFGEQEYGPGDYLVIPRGILHRYRMEDVPHQFFITEAAGEVHTPKIYRNEFGQIIERSPYSERDFRVPQNLQPIDKKEPTSVLVKQGNAFTKVILSHHPFDVVGWDGYYYPYVFNINDFEPIAGRIHEPPPVHLTFEGHNFVLCSFCPRPFDFDEDAIPAPYNHANVMSDEVLYYVEGNFMSRNGIEEGSITLHPDGLTHGPHPGKYEGSIGQKWTDELAVMVDTFRSLKVAKQAMEFEDRDYSHSWIPKN